MAESDREKGVRLREAAIARTVESAGPEWAALALEALRLLAIKQELLCADDLRMVCEEEGLPAHPYAHAGVLKSAQRLGYIRPTGRHESSEVASRHAAVSLQWESRIFEGERKFGGPCTPTTRWLLKAENQPAMQFKERPDALAWINYYAQFVGVSADEVEVLSGDWQPRPPV